MDPQTATTPPSAHLIGRLVFAGDLQIEGEEITAALVLQMDRDALRAAPSLPMYQDCLILPAAECPAMRAGGVSKMEEALHRIAHMDVIKWDADTHAEFEREFLPWAQAIAREALGQATHSPADSSTAH